MFYGAEDVQVVLCLLGLFLDDLLVGLHDVSVVVSEEGAVGTDLDPFGDADDVFLPLVQFTHFPLEVLLRGRVGLLVLIVF